MLMGYTGDELNDIYDKNDGYCWHCGKKLAFTNYGKPGERGAWEVDHSRPISKGGTDYLRNLVPTCIECNRSKGDLKSQEFERCL
jgi:5-methylcytosine-specific restriction endonuclease McrA